MTNPEKQAPAHEPKETKLAPASATATVEAPATALTRNSIDNDTVALIGLIVIALLSIPFDGSNIASVAIGAIGGFIGSRGNK